MQRVWVSRLASVIGLLSMLTCRWTSYIAGLPLVDSLYMVVIVMTLLGIKTNNPKMLILAIFIGPWAKESFIFIAPLIFFFSKINKWKQVLLFAISGLLVFSFRYYFDKFSNTPIDLSLKASFETFESITISLKRLFSFHGVYEVVSIFGIWGILIIGLFNKDIRIYLKQKTTLCMVLFLCIVLFQALLSTDLARMFYIGIPVIAIWVSLISDKILLLANSTGD